VSDLCCVHCYCSLQWKTLRLTPLPNGQVGSCMALETTCRSAIKYGMNFTFSFVPYLCDAVSLVFYGRPMVYGRP